MDAVECVIRVTEMEVACGRCKVCYQSDRDGSDLWTL